MSRPATRCIPVAGALALASALGACSGTAELPEAKQPASPGEYRILPSAPLATNELRFVAPESPAPDATVASAEEGSDGYSILWSVNGRRAGRGNSLPPGSYRRGDRVSVRFEQDAPERERAFVIIGNSPPSVESVTVQRDPARPNVAVAHFRATDPDRDALTHHFEWSVGGVVVPGLAGPEFPVGDADRGAEITVRVSSSDGELAASRASTIARLQNQAPVLTVGTVPQIVELDSGRQAELSLSVSDPDADAVEVRVEGPHVTWDAQRGILHWPLAEGSEEFEVTLRALDATGATSERTLRLKR